MFMIPSVTCCKLRSPSFWIVERCTCQKEIMLLWHGQVPFCYSLMFKKFLSLPNHSIRKKEINRGVGSLLDMYFMAMRKRYSLGKENIMWCQWEWKKSFKMFKIKPFWKKKQFFPTCVLFFLASPLLEDHSHRDNPNKTWTFCSLMRGVRYLEVFL